MVSKSLSTNKKKKTDGYNTKIPTSISNLFPAKREMRKIDIKIHLKAKPGFCTMQS